MLNIRQTFNNKPKFYNILLILFKSKSYIVLKADNLHRLFKNNYLLNSSSNTK